MPNVGSGIEMILVLTGAICGILLASVMLWAVVYVGARQEKRLAEKEKRR